MSNYSLFSTWRANFRPHIDGVRKRWDELVLTLVAGEGCEFTLEFDESYLTGDPESRIALHCVLDFLGNGIEFSPPEGQLVELVRDPQTFSSVTWILSTGQAQHGPFWIYFSMPDYSGMPESSRIPGMIFNDFVIEWLTTPDPNIFVGEPSRADIKVVDRESGLAMSKVSIEWIFAGIKLPKSQTADDGTSSIWFTPTEPGEQLLTATVQSGSKESLDYTVGCREVAELSISPSEVTLDGTFSVQARVFPSIEGKEVLFCCTGEMDQRVPTNIDGWASAVFKANQVPIDHLATVSATINAGREGERTLAKKVWVKDPASRNMTLWINGFLVGVPGLVVKLEPDKEHFVRIADTATTVEEYAIFLDYKISSIPSAGEFQFGNDDALVNWSINISAAVGERIALVVASKTGTFVRRMLIEVI